MGTLWEKILFWKKKPNRIKHGESHILTDEGLVKLLVEYPGVLYEYQNAKVDERGEGAVLSFHYEIIDAGEYDADHLKKDQKFITMIGDILVYTINEQIQNEQTRKNDS
jgi:hypothetical protein